MSLFGSFLMDESECYEHTPRQVEQRPRMWVKLPKHAPRAHREVCRNCGGLGVDLESSVVCFECEGEGKAEYWNNPSENIWK